VHARGISYNAIGSLVGLSANRVAEIAKDVRQVTAYEVLERVAVGLQIPRPAMGVGLLEPDSFDALDRRGDNVSEPPARRIVADHGPTPDLDMLAGLRTGLDEALASSTVSPRQMELIEESVAEHVQAYPASAPSLMLTRLASECAEVQALSRRRQPAMVQARLSGAAALLATMCADALMRLGEIRQAHLWYRTALVASDDSAEPSLRVLVRAQAAMLPYYFGDPHRTVSLADAALALSKTASPSSALAAAARARALARLGAVDAARTAIGEAHRSFDEVGDDDSDEAFRFPAKRLLFYLSGATTWIGDTASAYRVQGEALQLYQASPVKTLIDPALIRLDQAMCLASDRRTAEAASEAQTAVAQLPPLQRTELVLARATDVVEAIPQSKRGTEVAALSHYVAACRSQARTLTGGTVSPDP
jgi:tetratricopeptide (TPR) repeat protein